MFNSSVLQVIKSQTIYKPADFHFVRLESDLSTQIQTLRPHV